MALPSTLWDGAVKVTKAASVKGTPAERFDAAVKAAKNSADDVQRSADVSAQAAEDAIDEALDDIATPGRGGA